MDLRCRLYAPAALTPQKGPRYPNKVLPLQEIKLKSQGHHVGTVLTELPRL